MIRLEITRDFPGYKLPRSARARDRAGFRPVLISYHSDRAEAVDEIEAFKANCTSHLITFREARLYDDAAFRVDPLKAQPSETIR